MLLCSNFNVFGRWRVQNDAVAAAAQSTMLIVTTAQIVDPVAVADIEPAAGAIAPERELHEPREDFGEGWIESTGINERRNLIENVATAATPIAAWPIGMLGVEPLQNSGSVQKIVNQRTSRAARVMNVRRPE